MIHYIFDWDDTLCPSSYLLMQMDPLDAIHVEKLKILDFGICRLFSDLLASEGKISIVSNADEYWILETCRRFLPKVAIYLRYHRIGVMSAKMYFQSTQGRVGTPQEWKMAAFRSLYGNERGLDKQVISIGDAVHEHVACQSLAEQFGMVCKTLKFIDSPTMEEVIWQLDATVKSLQAIQLHSGGLNVHLQKTEMGFRYFMN